MQKATILAKLKGQLYGEERDRYRRLYIVSGIAIWIEIQARVYY